MAEGFLSGGTFISLLSCVNSLMHSHGRAVVKSFFTHAAFVRPLSSMDCLLLDGTYVICECFPTMNTVKRLLSHVIVPPMTYDGSILPEGFPTVSAFIEFFPRVDPLVMSQE